MQAENMHVNVSGLDDHQRLSFLHYDFYIFHIYYGCNKGSNSIHDF